MDRKEEQCGYQNYEKSMCKPPAFTQMQNGSVSHDSIDQFDNFTRNPPAFTQMQNVPVSQDVIDQFHM